MRVADGKSARSYLRWYECACDLRGTRNPSRRLGGKEIDERSAGRYSRWYLYRIVSRCQVCPEQRVSAVREKAGRWWEAVWILADAKWGNCVWNLRYQETVTGSSTSSPPGSICLHSRSPMSASYPGSHQTLQVRSISHLNLKSGKSPEPPCSSESTPYHCPYR